MEIFKTLFTKSPLDLLLIVAGVISLSAVVVLAAILLRKLEQTRELKKSFEKLNRSFNDLDEQAKLIVRTDLELNKAQEELDKRLSSLDALQRTSRLISTTLDANEIFNRLNKSLVNELGFEKCMILALDNEKKFQCRIETGFSKESVQKILRLSEDHSAQNILKEGRIFSSFNAPKQKKEKIIQIFDVEHFILSPILSQDGMVGILFVGNASLDAAITQGDEELLSILANQVGQSLENAQLFEQVYNSRQDLESNIQDRTRELELALEEVKRISKMKSEFISAVSHELRTPLTSIKGYASILLAGKLGDIPQEVKERLEKINKHSDNLVRFINDLLDISRIEAGRVQMTFDKHNIATLVENIRDLLAPQMKEKNIQFSVNLADQIPILLIDGSQIERVFINLLGNAVKFTPVNGSITLRGTRQNNEVLFEITDTGIGIKEADAPRLFDEFYRVDNEINQNVKGSGLGLTLVKNIVEAHGGKIWLNSKPSQGTTFYFTLPIKNT